MTTREAVELVQGIIRIKAIYGSHPVRLAAYVIERNTAVRPIESAHLPTSGKVHPGCDQFVQPWMFHCPLCGIPLDWRKA